MENRSLLFRDKRIHYTVSGQGQPVLLLHGFGEDSSIWERQVQALSQLCKLIVPDIPGSGQSEALPGAGIEEFADVIIQILEKEGSPAILLGHSMGGYIVLALAERYPEQVAALGLVHSTAYADSPERKDMRLKAMEFINVKGAHTFLKTSTPGMFSPAAQEQLRTDIQQLTERNRAFTAGVLCQYYRAMLERPDRTDVLRNAKVPVLMVIGEQDQAVPFSASLAQCHLPEQAHVHIFRHSAHMGMWEEAAKMTKVLSDFIKSRNG